jgi:hypothetical protein
MIMARKEGCVVILSISLFCKKNFTHKYIIFFSHDEFQLAPNEIAFLSRWLHTPRDDGTARVLILPIDYDPVHGRSNNKILLFIDGTIKMVNNLI